ncbi:MinD-like ATPase involved in chromosome partitioning or flagellar assembly [Trueperella bonasi]|uniref:MinD-like ATPase involved in chromosome partitioning or flagellar assembly n=1 Tax=Trueperella bonasi TaxID=312286 RepID=A0ABT9NIQ7_9ACTO|nr:hypothetical protein [Trueperella bonasi]MDP9806703.1 MinD-like ATPase involved in chromosome partitioning or flagellar assembly [Trueperella bonasi]
MILLCLPDHLDDALLRELAELGEEDLVARRCADLAEVLAGVDAGLARSVLLSGDEPGLDLSVTAALHGQGVRVGVVPHGRPISDLRALGVEVVSEGELLAFVRNSSRIEEIPAKLERGRIIAVWGPGGSVGRTALVRDLAALAQDVLVVDADTHRPSLTQLYGLEETSAIVALARHIERGKNPDDLVDSLLVDIPGKSGAGRLLAGLNTGERWRELPRVVVDRMWEALASQAQTVLVDLSGGMDLRPERVDRYAATRSALEAADVVLHVGKGTPVGLRRFLEHIDAVGPDASGDHVGVVITSRRALGMDGGAKVRELLADVPIRCEIVRGDRDRLDECELMVKAMPASFPRSKYSRDVSALWDSLARALP